MGFGHWLGEPAGYSQIVLNISTSFDLYQANGMYLYDVADSQVVCVEKYSSWSSGTYGTDYQGSSSQTDVAWDGSSWAFWGSSFDTGGQNDGQEQLNNELWGLGLAVGIACPPVVGFGFAVFTEAITLGEIWSPSDRDHRWFHCAGPGTLDVEL